MYSALFSVLLLARLGGDTTVPEIAHRQLSLGGQVQYHITTAGDPMPGSAVDLRSPDAWLFFDNIRPSVIRDRYLSRITVHGAKAVIDSNVRVVQYLQGCVVMAQGADYQPLTVYAGVSDSMRMGMYTYYRLGALGSLDNRISSFLLKRGYMATFADNPEGTGASKVYVAADSDVRVSVLPEALRGRISYVRVFPWRWVAKKGWTNGIRLADTLHCQWNYDWGNSRTSTLDIEYVPMRWNLRGPDIAVTNALRNTTELLGYNEPDHTDQANMTPDQAIAQWPLLEQSGLRLGAPGVSDGGLRWLYTFMDKADSAGFRIDFVPVHFYRGCYSAAQFYGFLKAIHDRTRRPIWVTEWNNGANWTTSAECPKPTYQQQADTLRSFLHMLDTCSFVERYSLYEWVEDTRQLFLKSKDTLVLNPAGLVYRDDASPMAYSAAAQDDSIVVSRLPRRRRAGGVAGVGPIDKAAGEGLAPLITDMPSRRSTSLNGRWRYIIDPYETGFLDYRYKELAPHDPGAYWNSDVPRDKTDKLEFGYSDKYTLQVPGDWNHQGGKFEYLEGTVWYEKTFDYRKSGADDLVYLYFGAVNYRADVYLNGHKLGWHKGGFTPFDLRVPDSLLRVHGNYLVVRVDNRRFPDEVPTVNTDWWNYGGITREVRLVELPPTHIRSFFLQVKRPPAGEAPSDTAEGWVRVDGPLPASLGVDIPELGIHRTFATSGATTPIRLQLGHVRYWSPETPVLYRVMVHAGSDKLVEKLGFRTIQVDGKKILLNGKPVLLRGICIHEEVPGLAAGASLAGGARLTGGAESRGDAGLTGGAGSRGDAGLTGGARRAYSRQDAALLLGWAKELGCNMVRLAHYPHDETMTRMADSLGILVWSEIPVYWTIEFGNREVYEKALAQLSAMIDRDRNRSSIILWSVGNETPVSDARTSFMRRLAGAARAMDATRLVTAAMEVNYGSGRDRHVVDDPLGKYVDVVSFNEYLGWYGGLPSACRTADWSTPYDKPMFISETGAGALGGFHGDSLTRWSEEYQQWYYREQVAMLRRMPDNFAGCSPWILVDFRSPKRNNPVYQEGWNNKGLIGHTGRKKKAFWVLKRYYDEVRRTGSFQHQDGR